MPALSDAVHAALCEHSPESVERSLLAAFVTSAGLAPHTDSAVAQAAATADPLLVATLRAHAITLEDLIRCFETLVPAAAAASEGAVFTPASIAAFMSEQAVAAYRGNLRTATVIDPAVGCGALLVAMLTAIAERTGEPASAVASRLYGCDINADSVRRAALLVGVACLVLGDDTPPHPRLSVGDSLAASQESTFSIVIANPPYVRFQELSQSHRHALSPRWQTCGKGNYNLYFPFFELARALVAPDGVAVAITPNGFLTAASAAPLRGWFASTGWLDTIVDFGHHRVFEAMTYTAVTIATPDPSSTLGYIQVAGVEGLAGLPADWRENAVSRYAHLSATPWRMVNRTRRAFIDTVTTTGRPLSQVCRVSYGLATLRDKLYLLDGTHDDEGNYLTAAGGTTYPIEPGITRAVVKVAGMTPDALAANNRRIIAPYRNLGAGSPAVLDEEELVEDYPLAHRYLSAVRDELARRDNGSKVYPEWFAYGRSQGLAPLGQALITPLYAGRPRFMPTDAVADALMINGCAVTLTDPQHIDPLTLALLLNSAVTHCFVESTANAINGGFFAYQKPQLAPIGIPLLSAPQRQELHRAPPIERDAIIADIYGVELPEGYPRVG